MLFPTREFRGGEDVSGWLFMSIYGEQIIWWEGAREGKGGVGGS
jgi:hypothetical protein